MPAPDFQSGSVVTAEALNEWSLAAESGSATVDGSSGLVGVKMKGGAAFRAQSKGEMWAKVGPTRSGGPSGSYTLTEQVDLEAGAFAVGLWVRDGFPTPGSATPPTDGSATVRAWRDRSSWRFEWGSC